jgi:hypothetical protein
MWYLRRRPWSRDAWNLRAAFAAVRFEWTHSHGARSRPSGVPGRRSPFADGIPAASAGSFRGRASARRVCDRAARAWRAALEGPQRVDNSASGTVKITVRPSDSILPNPYE